MIKADAVRRAAESLKDTIDHGGGLVIAAGAGMGVDSGLPDFRGPEGFWKAYPAYRQLGLRFEELANAAWFDRDPTLAWGFYGHRLNLYRGTAPHEGFAILRRWGTLMTGGSRIFTSNVDGQFQKAGFPEDSIMEVHGSLHHLQCLRPACGGIWSAESLALHVDENAFRSVGDLPRCPQCGGLARPNVLMFGDGNWEEARTAAQHERLYGWLDSMKGKPLVVVECGAGTAVASVRAFTELLAARRGAQLIRINLREAQGPAGIISLESGALEALRQMVQVLGF